MNKHTRARTHTHTCNRNHSANTQRVPVNPEPTPAFWRANCCRHRWGIWGAGASEKTRRMMKGQVAFGMKGQVAFGMKGHAGRERCDA